MQKRVKIRFEHMYLRLRNFHRGVDLNILTPLTMKTRIVIIGKMNFDDDRQFFLPILNSISTSENNQSDSKCLEYPQYFLCFLSQQLELHLTESSDACEEMSTLLSQKIHEDSWLLQTRVRQLLTRNISQQGQIPISKLQD